MEIIHDESLTGNGSRLMHTAWAGKQSLHIAPTSKSGVLQRPPFSLKNYRRKFRSLTSEKMER